MKYLKESLVEKYNKKILGICGFSFFGNMFFDRAIWTIFLLSKGISIIEIGIIESTLHLAIFLFEIPTGIVADLHGRKFSLIISRFLCIIYGLGMIFFDKVIYLIIIFVILGISETFESGADTALLYELTDGDEEEKEKNFIKISGKYGFCATMGLFIAMILGGIFKVISWNLVYFSFICVQAISIIFLMLIDEREINVANDNLNIKSVVTNLMTSTKDVLTNKVFFILILGIVIFTASINSIYLFMPIWFKNLGITETVISIIYGIDSIIGAVIYANVSKMENKININKLILVPPILAALNLILICFVSKNFAIVLFVIINNCVILFYVLSSTLINKRIKSENRATVLSTVSFINSFVMIIIFPIMGYSIEHFSINVVFGLLCILCIISIALIVRFKKLSTSD